MKKLKRIIITTFAVISLLLVSTVAIIYIISSPEAKTFSDGYDRNVVLSYFPKYAIYSADGQLIDKVNARGYSAVSPDDISTVTKNAFLAIEDSRFYEHGAVDPARIAKAITTDIITLSAKEGASTITQQFAKNAFLSSEKTFERKIKELKIARQIESEFTKDEILCAYLNCIYFGNDSYGIGVAAKRYFGKRANELTLDESALLAGLINNPSRYDPFTNNSESESRKKLVLKKMADNGYINTEEKEDAQNPTDIKNDKINNKIFIDFTECELSTDVITAYDTNIQKTVEDALKETANDNCKVAVMVMDAHTRKPVAAASNFYSNASKIYRQPGSTIKPIMCYAPLIEENKLHPLTPLLDEKTDFDGYFPKNYENKYYGWISAEDCLIKSLNIPAIKLLNTYGIEKSKAFATKFGIQFDDEDNGLSLALGGMRKGINLLQICKAYSIFADNGKNIISPETAYFINKMLMRCADEGTAKKLKGLGIAAKTGTVGDNDANSDAYCVSYSTDYVVAVWYGSEDKSNLNTTGGGAPAEISKKIWKNSALKRGEFKKPNSIVNVYLDCDELMNNHKFVLSNGDTLPYKKICAEFSIYNMPENKIYEELHFNGENFNVVDSFVQ